MRQLHIIACVKVVPKPEEVKVNPENWTIERDGVRSEINPPDMNVLEMALALKEQHGGKVTVVAMGPPMFDSYLRLALAMGADEAYLLSDRSFAGADTLATSYALAQGIRKIGEFDLILCGEESSDGATAQVPPGIAEWLNTSQITYAEDLKIVPDSGMVKAQRETWANAEGPVTTWNAQDIEVDPEMIGIPGSPTIVDGVAQAEATERKREFLKGTPEEQVKALIERLRPYL